MIKININKDYLEFFQAKRDICEDLIKQDIINEELSVPDFINYIDFSKSILVIQNDSYPFKYIKTNNNEYLFYMIDNNQTPDILINELTKINFDFSNLKEKSKEEIALEQLLDKPFFILNNKLMFNL